ncbi:carbamoyltransferase HypF [Roseinatronobacter sp. NSM]|uniref:carbamoyltransferase HypF n=1 Tax=Roseinatronobacter sp. NSM TaxID=3457785 RepID=UPI00403567F1
MTQARIRVRGQVQGVGFRPFVWTLARRLGLRGRVRNDAEGVLIDAAGAQLPQFVQALRTDLPPLARIDALEVSALDADDLPPEFEIIASTGGAARTRVTPDAATCPACLAEIRDPAARRFGYAFANCTHCGPRFSILQSLPYDRGQTTMAAFVFCAECAGEYGDPSDRRFHAQPIACPACGPRLWFERAGSEMAGDAIALAAQALRAGEILAIKGLGGFHLACDARSERAVALLRARKHRPDKPFALMGQMKMIAQHCHVTAQERARLRDAAAPILLLARRPDAGALAPAVAPGQACLGWMLPYTPLHHLLLDTFGGPLVMTSGNRSGEPQVICNAIARDALAGFADAFVMHDRDIARRLDDSVERVTPFGPMVLRHARGRAPATLRLPPGFDAGPQVLAMGGQMKGAFCLTRGNEALLSHHLGDLDDAQSWSETRRALADYADLFDHIPTMVAVDLHEGFRATQHGRAMGLPVQGVQHHHAHMAACLGDNMWPLDGPRVAAIVLDGLGLGLDGTIWGGELLLGDYAGFDRLAWLAPAPLPGGDAAGRAPWRNALVRLDAAGLGGVADRMFADQPRGMLRQAVAAGLNAPLSSSAGRLFDAVAAMLGLSAIHQSFEGQAAMALEALAGQVPRKQVRPYPMGDGPAIGVGPLFEALVQDLGQGVAHEVIAARFHAGLAQAFADRAAAVVRAGVADAVVLSGGCFQNVVLLGYTMDALHDTRVMVHGATPANDGGLAYGQALVALARHKDRGRG